MGVFYFILVVFLFLGRFVSGCIFLFVFRWTVVFLIIFGEGVRVDIFSLLFLGVGYEDLALLL